jgi:hypothetical protein
VPRAEPRRETGTGAPKAVARATALVVAAWLSIAGRAGATPVPIGSPSLPATPVTTSRPTEAPLGQLEQESVDEGLIALGLRIDPRPEGKLVGRIFVVNQDVFSRHDWYFQLLNIFHRTTRPEHLRRELLIGSGQPYDRALIEESIRNLRSPPSLVIANRTTIRPPELSSVVAIVPIASPIPGTVDLLAVTRDLWSLRFNTYFEFQQNTLSLLSTSLSENNLFGWRKYVSLGFDMDQGRYGFGPAYIDPNVAGSRLILLARATVWYARDTHHHEGDNELFALRYPLFSLASRWGAGLDVSHQDAVVRSFRGNQLRTEDLTATPDKVEALPYQFRRRILTTDVNVLRSFVRGTVIQRVIVGHRFDRRRSLVLPDFPTDPDNPRQLQQFLDQVAPLSETRSEPYLRYEIFTARYGVFRDLDTFDLRENRQLGPSLKVEIGAGLTALGADFQAFPLGAEASWAVGSDDGAYGYALIEASTRARAGGFIDQNLTTKVAIASPPIARLARLMLYAQTDAVRNDTHRTPFFIGGSTGLRGYAIGDFEGTSDFVAHVELRSAPVAVFSQRFGGLLFYDAGDAAASFGALVPHHDAGLGLRWLIPQLNSAVLRFDWAVAMQNGVLTRAGLPGRFSAGFLQVF